MCSVLTIQQIVESLILMYMLYIQKWKLHGYKSKHTKLPFLSLSPPPVIKFPIAFPTGSVHQQRNHYNKTKVTELLYYAQTYCTNTINYTYNFMNEIRNSRMFSIPYIYYIVLVEFKFAWQTYTNKQQLVWLT